KKPAEKPADPKKAAAKATAKPAAKPDAKKKDAGVKPSPIDFDGLDRRVIRLPVDTENIRNLTSAGDNLLYIKRGANFYGRDSYAKSDICIFSMKTRSASTFAADAKGYSLSRDGRKAIVKQGKSYYVCDVQPQPKSKTAVSTAGLVVDRVPAEEWAEIFDEVWRRFRDFFYVKNMHGYDWKAIGERYRKLVPHVAHRSDLNYLIGEMIAELNIGHAYIQGGDYNRPKRPVVGLPGATFELDAQAKRFRIAKIYPGQNEETRYRAPLAEVGIDASVGEYVLAIDGRELKPDDNPYRLLQHKTGTVTLALNKKPTLDGARKVTYEPIRDERALRYLEWTRGNREKVAKATAGRVGYLHLPNMGADGIREFVKWFYPQIRKQGLIVDVRGNGGGNISPWIIERLGRKLLGTRFGSDSDEAGTYPKTVFHGHMVCIINENSASDGDIFPYRFRQAGIGPLIGKRSWGGVVGISGRGPLIDGGTVYVPLQATNSPSGQWIIEGHGVDPDIEVDNDPNSVIQGRDPQLERAIAEIIKRIKADPKKLPKRPPDPIKTKLTM
ncbi:MAG: S41 family peptidase, partial [Planctomycetota bacterium]|nr:S41 family peptidase [Planctomycetota bacterium]